MKLSCTNHLYFCCGCAPPSLASGLGFSAPLSASAVSLTLLRCTALCRGPPGNQLDAIGSIGRRALWGCQVPRVARCLNAITDSIPLAAASTDDSSFQHAPLAKTLCNQDLFNDYHCWCPSIAMTSSEIHLRAALRMPLGSQHLQLASRSSASGTF